MRTDHIAATLRMGFLYACAIVMLATFVPTVALADEPVTNVAFKHNPTPFHAEPGGLALLPLREMRAVHGELNLTLDMQYGFHTIAGQPAWLRGYNGDLAGPTIRARPGDTLNIQMINSLPENACNTPGSGGHGGHSGHAKSGCGKPINDPHGFNTSNLHTHGLWVSPEGNSDNVLLSLYPGDEFRNEIKIPVDHPPGTHWYHAHHHGSVALQVSSGFAGALIIEGGLDDVPAIAAAREVTLVFQQVAYSKWDCMGEDGKDVRPPELIEKGAGCIESYTNFGPGIWPHVKDESEKVDDDEFRYTTINGQAQPTLYARPGEVLRFRTIHAGVRESIHIAIRSPVGGDGARAAKLGDVLKMLDDMAGLNDQDLRRRAPVESYLPKIQEQIQLLKLYEIANDGIAFGRVDETDNITLQPGYRSDFLVRFDRPGDYVVLDLPASGGDQLLSQGPPENSEILAYVRVGGDPKKMELPTQEDVAGLAPYPTITDEELTSCQDSVFNIQLGNGDPALFTVNDQSYDPEQLPRSVGLGRVEEWRLVSKFVNHPFHIHVNPFEVQSTDPSKPNVWRDTLLVKGPPAAARAGEPQELCDLGVRIRTRYRRYIGKYVLHCHILDHEDEGMMQEVEVMLHPPAGSSVACNDPVNLGRFPGTNDPDEKDATCRMPE